jgi:ketosteroid isomerase-like protein
MMTIRQLGALALVLGLTATAGAAEKDPLASTLRKVMEDNVAAYNARDVDAVMRGVHTRSPEYDTTKTAVAAQFREVQARARVLDFDLIGHDDEFAYARLQLAVGGPPTGNFQDDVVDSLLVFHQENGTWKLWMDEVLGVEFVKFIDK